MLTKLRDFFNFNATERNGIIVLFILIVLIAFLPRIYRLISKPDEMDLSAFQAEIKAFDKQAQAPAEKEYHEQVRRVAIDKEDIAIHLTPFDPNLIGAKEWNALGLKDWQVRIIMNYRLKGGKFRSKEDVGKIYGIKPELYKKLEPFIRIPIDTISKQNALQKKLPFIPKKLCIDINSADTTALQELKGIGPAFARRIVKYRDLLGGYYKVEQLLEVYGFDQERYRLIAPDCNVGKGPIRLMNLNTVSTADLRKHPYLNYSLAKAIVDARITRGHYNSIDELKMIPQITDELFEKIHNYLIIE
ncbi:MAG: helix-hairpin-helix domain-containing protein [Bacteroidetes bacterium]|nr:helix-hairpin-helix domain-containing protein [Bacteroidota bacterium]